MLLGHIDSLLLSSGVAEQISPELGEWQSQVKPRQGALVPGPIEKAGVWKLLQQPENAVLSVQVLKRASGAVLERVNPAPPLPRPHSGPSHPSYPIGLVTFDPIL